MFRRRQSPQPVVIVPPHRPWYSRLPWRSIVIVGIFAIAIAIAMLQGR
jgi:hypothetical protein